MTQAEARIEIEAAVRPLRIAVEAMYLHLPVDVQTSVLGNLEAQLSAASARVRDPATEDRYDALRTQHAMEAAYRLLRAAHLR